MHACKNCQQNFEVTEKDLDFYKRMEVPVPVFCSNCRRQRRLSFRNERNLYLRNCDFSGKQMVTVYAPDAVSGAGGEPIKVYHHDVWWSDKWDAKEYAMDYDFNRPFFEQFNELQGRVPRMNMIISHCENSDYAPYSVKSKNCYMCVSANGSEDICYSYQANASKDCMDCSLCHECELCYECVYCVKSYKSFWSANCNNCSELYFCRDCQGCKNCIGCCGLKNKSFYVFNREVSEEEFLGLVSCLNSRGEIAKMAQQFDKFSMQFPFRACYTTASEGVSGDHLINSKDSAFCYEASELENCKYMYTIPFKATDCQDCNYSQYAELCFDSISACFDYNAKFVLHSWDVKNASYVHECYYSSDLFGCIGLKQSKFCILNKQYSEQEYNEMVPRIIEHMKKTPHPAGQASEWGQYLPMNLSLFAYNESIAHEIFPLTKEHALQKGCRWKEKDLSEYKSSSCSVPDSVDALNNDIIGRILACTDCGKNYKIIDQEFKFYKKNNLPAPEKCPNCRHKKRISLRNLSDLWDVNCGRCHQNLKSCCDPNKYSQIYCEKCFLEVQL